MDITDWLVAMLNALSEGAGPGVDSLLLAPEAYNGDLYQAALTIHSTAVKPVTSIVLSIMFVLMLATTSTRAEGDRELGVRIIAATMFKIAMVFVVAQNAVLLLEGISGIATYIMGAANNIDVGTGGGDAPLMGDAMRDDLDGLGDMEKFGMVVILFLPWVVQQLASVIAILLVFIRFLQMYLLTAFASLPIAFLGHEDTKGIGIGYLKGFATVAFTGVVIVVAVKMYQALLGGWLGGIGTYDGDIVGFIFGNFGQFFVAPLVLIFLLFGANGLAKKVIGEG